MAASPASGQSYFHLEPSLGYLEAEPVPGCALDHPTYSSDGCCSPEFPLTGAKPQVGLEKNKILRVQWYCCTLQGLRISHYLSLPCQHLGWGCGKRKGTH